MFLIMLLLMLMKTVHSAQVHSGVRLLCWIWLLTHRPRQAYKFLVEVEIMIRTLARIISMTALIVIISATALCQIQGALADKDRPLQKAKQPSVTIKDQQSAPLSFRIVAVEPIPDKPEMVKIILRVEAKAAQSVRQYSVHYEEVWKDRESGNGALVSDLTSPQKLPHDLTFIARKNAIVELWLSSVEFVDGAEWKSRLNSSFKSK